jgi:hypothetical protein
MPVGAQTTTLPWPKRLRTAGSLSPMWLWVRSVPFMEDWTRLVSLSWD